MWGVKDSGGEEGYAEAVLGAGKGVHLGTEDDLWRRLGTGAQGAISALANFAPEEVLEVYPAATENDETRDKALSEGLKEARAMTKQYSSPAVLEKLAEARHGVPMGTVRPPFVSFPKDYDPEAALTCSRSEAGG